LVCFVSKPIKELKAFERVFLKAGESKTIEFTLSPKDFKFYDWEMNCILELGNFSIMVGNSSKDNDVLTVNLNIK
jgi:beta-glucosidase